MEAILALLQSEMVVGALVAVLTMLLPVEVVAQVYKRLLDLVEKVPIVGAVVGIVRRYVEKVKAHLEAEKLHNAAEAAEVLVNGAEQLKKIGVLDSPTAAVQVTQKLQETFKLDTDTARTVTESAVRNMQRWDR